MLCFLWMEGLQECTDLGRKYTSVCFYQDHKRRDQSVTFSVKEVTRGIQMDCNDRFHISGDPSTLRSLRVKKSDPDKTEQSLSSRTCWFENTGDTACHQLFILLGNVCKCWTSWHDLEMRLNITRASETPPNGKFVMLERKQQISQKDFQAAVKSWYSERKVSLRQIGKSMEHVFGTCLSSFRAPSADTTAAFHPRYTQPVLAISP